MTRRILLSTTASLALTACRPSPAAIEKNLYLVRRGLQGLEIASMDLHNPRRSPITDDPVRPWDTAGGLIYAGTSEPLPSADPVHRVYRFDVTQHGPTHELRVPSPVTHLAAAGSTRPREFLAALLFRMKRHEIYRFSVDQAEPMQLITTRPYLAATATSMSHEPTLAWSPQQDRLAFSNRNLIELIRVSDGKLLVQFEGASPRFSHAGTRLAYKSAQTIRIRSAEDGQLITEITRPREVFGNRGWLKDDRTLLICERKFSVFPYDHCKWTFLGVEGQPDVESGYSDPRQALLFDGPKWVD